MVAKIRRFNYKFIILIWTILVLALLSLSIKKNYEFALKSAVETGKALWLKDVIYREWNASHGGVYAPISKNSPPNPYLKVKERDITTPSGKKLTLINPAYMTRQVYEITNKKYNIKGHITSLKPIRPQNKPDKWETEALKSFEKGKKSYYSIVSVNDKKYLRFMKPLITKKVCLKCHKFQGYKVGDVRGGISIKIPMDKYYAIAFKNSKIDFIAYFLIWLIGLLAILYALKHFNLFIEKINSQKQQLESIINGLDKAGIGLFIINKDYRIEYLNNVLKVRFKAKEGDLCYETFLKSTQPCKNCDIGNKNIYSPLHLPDSSVFERASVPIITTNGTLGNLVILQDITEKHKFIKDLEETKEKAEIANKAKSEFLANMSHEIRTPMNAILGFIDILYDTELTEQQKNYLDIIKSSSENLLKILNDILDVSKLEAGKTDFEKQTFNLKTLINSCINIFSEKAGEKGISLKYKIADNVPDNLVGDYTRISQVINNLLSNAIKFTDKGEVGVEVKLIKMENNFAEILFIVYDTGVGIPQDKIDTIFESFSQADVSITRKYGGTGLGLTIISKIIKAYNGKIWVESEVGKGSKFYFTLKLPIGDKEVKYEQEVSNTTIKDGILNFHKAKNESENLEGLKELIGNDEELLKTLIKSFKESFHETLNQIKEGIEKQDFEKIKFAAHSIKGSAYNIKFNKIGKICEEIENLTKNRDLELIKKLTKKLESFQF